MCGSGGELGLMVDNECALSPIPRLYNTFMKSFQAPSLLPPEEAESGGLLSKFIGESRIKKAGFTTIVTKSSDGVQRKGQSGGQGFEIMC